MTQRSAVYVSLGLTTFVLVLLWSILSRLAGPSNDPPQTSLVGSAATTVAVATTPARVLPPETTSSVSAPTITPNVATAIGLAHAPGATLLREPEVVDFDGVLAYEVLLDRGQIYVAATSGQVLQSTVPTLAVSSGREWGGERSERQRSGHDRDRQRERHNREHDDDDD
ncbi:MAG: hypothetical protein HY329_15075 [Chloroflexi bacterium]|nr:hypothetical protein [Chloroflexota bacterium]